MTVWPSAKRHSSTCGLIVVALTPGTAGQAGHVDLVVEVADVADDRLVLHPRHVLGGDDVRQPVAVMKMSAIVDARPRGVATW